MTESFTGKTVVVTGAGRGIGRAIADAFADAGAAVVIAARTMVYAQEAATAIRSRGGTVSVFEIDVKDCAAVEALIADTVERYGGVDVIVHAAADIPHGGIDDVTDEAIDAGLTSIVKAAFWITRAARPHLRQARDGGRLIFIGSTTGPKMVLLGRLFYGVAKSGLDAFVRGAALELAGENITVNSIEPGLIESARVKVALDQTTIDAIGRKIPVPRAGTVDEIAHTAMFLASARSGYITGTSIVVDGGSILSTAQINREQLADHDKQNQPA